nr:MAG TPA: hypothetical protein [Caudoviricetes sp.]
MRLWNAVYTILRAMLSNYEEATKGTKFLRHAPRLMPYF